MEYITYILIISGIMAVCFVLLPEKAVEHTLKKLPPKTVTPIETPRVEVALDREALNVRIPWGWPGHDEHVTANHHATINAQEVHGVSETLHWFADRLLSEKQTIDSREYLMKKEASLRALLEDRYGRAYQTHRAKKRNVQAPLSRDLGKALVMGPLQDVKTPWGW